MHSPSKHGAAKQAASPGAEKVGKLWGHQQRAGNCQLLQEACWRRPQLLRQSPFQLLQVRNPLHTQEPKAFYVAA